MDRAAETLGVPGALPEPEALWASLEQVVRLGNRFVGTPGEIRCRELLLEEFERAGHSRVRTEEFTLLGYEPVSARCQVIEEGWELVCAPLQCTADGVAEGEAVYLGSGSEEEVNAVERRGVDLRGKIAVAHSYFTFLVAPQLVQRGVAGLVNVGETPDGLVGHFTAALYPPPLAPPWEGRVLPFPGVTIEAQAARRLLAMSSARPLRVRVEHRARYAETVTANVVTEIPAGRGSDELVLVGAHYDTQLEGPGAADNGTGVATLLELARCWRRLRPRRTVVLVAFAAEEPALWGSYRYAFEHRDQAQRTVGMVNLDAMGLPFPGRRVVMADESIAGFAADHARRVGWHAEAHLDASLHPFGDYAPFVDAGIPACWLWRFPPQHPYYHSAGDTPAYVDAVRFTEDARAGAAVALALADEPKLGFGRARPTRRWTDTLQAGS